MFENPRRGRQARNFTTNVPKILDLKSSSEQIFSRKLSLGAPALCCVALCCVALLTSSAFLVDILNQPHSLADNLYTRELEKLKPSLPNR